MGRNMKKIISIVFTVLILITGCNYDPNSLMYGETRHMGIIEGKYSAEYKGLVYEFIFAEEPIKDKEIKMTLNIYIESSYPSKEIPDATFTGSCCLVSKVYEENYINKDKFNSYNVYEIIINEQDSTNFKIDMFNGRVMVKICDRGISDADKYDYNKYIRPSIESTLCFRPLDNWNEAEKRPDYPRLWHYQGNLQ